MNKKKIIEDKAFKEFFVEINLRNKNEIVSLTCY